MLLFALALTQTGPNSCTAFVGTALLPFGLPRLLAPVVRAGLFLAHVFEPGEHRITSEDESGSAEQEKCRYAKG
ncbi:hypothetical protein Lesp02_32030 [Lentzea sp. NBRC 105346]|uniref:hypothetical protein n=1 Tax=Lentzea sp. NBRC 105346 TaxID=3032205 RepID=UPI0024A52758|nr:hypothetical protein [Lentzea sp. NBRC 105346]GLZ31014.1 hypothetical protein Lesp02_32030 [Lentzea sp. NBRC 105346]